MSVTPPSPQEDVEQLLQRLEACHEQIGYLNQKAFRLNAELAMLREKVASREATIERYRTGIRSSWLKKLIMKGDLE